MSASRLPPAAAELRELTARLVTDPHPSPALCRNGQRLAEAVAEALSPDAPEADAARFAASLLLGAALLRAGIETARRFPPEAAAHPRRLLVLAASFAAELAGGDSSASPDAASEPPPLPAWPEDEA